MKLFKKLWRSGSPFSRLCVVFAVGFALFAFSNAEPTWRDFGIAIIILPCWALLWYWRQFAWWAKWKKRPEGQSENPWLAWSLEPITCALLIGLISINVFTFCRFVLGVPWLGRFAKEKLAETNASVPKGWDGHGNEWLSCGPYKMTKWAISTAEDGTPEFLMITAYDTLTDAAGFAYVPSGGRPTANRIGCGPSYFSHIIGPWWRWRWDI